MDKDIFRTRLTQLRMQKGISARDMSISIGQSPGYINNIENGINLPSMATFFYICDFFNISPEDFFEIDSKNPEKMNRLIENLKLLNERQLDLIFSLVEELLHK